MKSSYPVLKFSLIALILVTLAAFIATILVDHARDNSYNIVFYIFASLALLVAIINSYGGYMTFRDARSSEQPVAWYKHYRLTYGILLLLGMLVYLYVYGLASKFPHGIQTIVTSIILVMLGIPSLIFSILTTRNKSRT
jgi:peptidoglycan/LPS O-acetylase OafA/YrhL